MVVACAPDGTTLWGRDPWWEVSDKLLGGRTAQGYGLPLVVSPTGEIWFYVSLSLSSESIQALVVYGPAGDTLYCDRVLATVPLLFTPQSTCFCTVVSTERGDACREFGASRGVFTLVRTLTLPPGFSWIRAVGSDGSLLCRYPDDGRTLIESHTVYRPGAKLRFTILLVLALIAVVGLAVCLWNPLRPQSSFDARLHGPADVGERGVGRPGSLCDRLERQRPPTGG
jgi:hypothetical protein